MGEQTTVVLVGFVLIHVALVLSITSLATPVWVKGEHNSTRVNSTDENMRTKGLWHICERGECVRVNETVQTGDFVAVQILFTLGSAQVLIGTLIVYVYMAVQSLRKCKKAAIVSTLINVIALGLLTAAVCIFGVKEYSRTSDLGAVEELSLGWSYWCGVAADFFMFITFLASVYRYKILTGLANGYEDI